MKKLTKYQNRFCGCMRNSEKTAPKDPNFINDLHGIKNNERGKISQRK